MRLTGSSRAVLKEAVSANTGRENGTLPNLTKQEQKTLAGLLKKVLARLEPDPVWAPVRRPTGD